MRLLGRSAAADGLIRERRLRPAGALALAASPRGPIVAAGYGSGLVVLTPDLTSRIQRIPVAATVRALCFSTHEGTELLAVAFRGRMVASYTRDGAGPPDAPFGRHPIAVWPAHDNMIETVAFHAPGSLATGSRDGTVALWDATTGSPLAAQLPTGAAVEGLCAFGHGRLVVALLDGRLQRWSLDEARLEAEVATGLRSLTAFAAWPDGGLVWVAGADGKVVAVDVERLSPLWRERLPTAWVTSLAAGGPSAPLAAGAGDGTIWLLDPAAGDVLGSVRRARDEPIVALAYAHDGALAALHGGARVALWRPPLPDGWELLRRFALRGEIAPDLRAALQDAAERRDARGLQPWLQTPGSNPYRGAGEAGQSELARRLQAVLRRVSSQGSGTR